jgi:hypothetical protein
VGVSQCMCMIHVFPLAGMIGDACQNVLFISNCQVILCCWHSAPNLHLLPQTFLLREINTKKNRGMLLTISFANPLLFLFSIFCTTCILDENLKNAQ